MSKKVDYFKARQISPLTESCELVEIDPRLVPLFVSSLYTYTTSSFWETELDYISGYNRVANAIERLLMPCAAEIVNNLIALRGIAPSAPRDEVYGVPIAPPQGSTLLDIFNTLQAPSSTPGMALERIAAATERTALATEQGLLAEEGGETVARIAQLALLL